MCDEVRTEDNGKNLYIGVYGMDIGSTIKPSIFDVTHILGVEFGNTPNTVELRTEGAGIRTQRIIEIPKDSYFLNIITPMKVPAIEPRDLRVDVRIGEGEWINVGIWKFSFPTDALDAPLPYSTMVAEFYKASREASNQRASSSSSGTEEH